MSKESKKTLTVVVPVYNEESGLAGFHVSLTAVLQRLPLDWLVLYVDDGSTDGTSALVRSWHQKDSRVRLLSFSRNFGKENALTAGILAATGDCILTLDGDDQHPVELIPQFVESWQNGAQVVVGVRSNPSGNGFSKTLASRVFYRLFNSLSRDQLVPGSTDFRLIDKRVQRAFGRLPEVDRMTRGLIDWLGFERTYIHFTAKQRAEGSPGYSRRKLVELAMNSIVSSTVLPLYLFGYLGIFITSGAFVLGSVVFVEQLVLEDPLHWHFTGTAMLSILLLFLVGIVLLSQGLLSLYISHIHRQTKGRPLYVIDYERSAGIVDEDKP